MTNTNKCHLSEWNTIYKPFFINELEKIYNEIHKLDYEIRMLNRKKERYETWLKEGADMILWNLKEAKNIKNEALNNKF